MVLEVMIAVVFATGGYWFSKAIEARRPPIVVEEYKLEVVGTEGFKKVITRFQEANGRLHRFEWHPGYAHHFSDELVKASARALAPGQAE